MNGSVATTTKIDIALREDKCSGVRKCDKDVDEQVRLLINEGRYCCRGLLFSPTTFSHIS